MYESLWALFITMCSVALNAYWFFWAYLLVTKDADLIDPMLDFEHKRLRRLFLESMPAGTPLLQSLDCLAMRMWYRANRPFSTTFVAPDDVASAVGRKLQT
jgi:hypothetical protein